MYSLSADYSLQKKLLLVVGHLRDMMVNSWHKLLFKPKYVYIVGIF